MNRAIITKISVAESPYMTMTIIHHLNTERKELLWDGSFSVHQDPVPLIGD